VLLCSECGFENPDGHRFCGACGGSLTQVVERRKLVTSVFCDLSGSTELGERVDAETVFELMRSYFETAREALERHGGAVEKFIGDAVVGMFGVPEAHEDDALRACRAALEIQARVRELERERETEIAVRIGVNTGEVVAGDAARREMFASVDAVVLGDSVNVAARLEQAASPGEVLIGEATHRLVREAASVEPVPPIEAKGKAEPLIAYRLVAVRGQMRHPRAALVRLIGRVSELALLESEFEAVVAEWRCRVVTLVGEPGVGKSRLAAELVERVGERARFARGACLSYGEGITLWPLAQVVRELAGIEDDQSAEEARESVPRRIAQMLGLVDGSMTSDQIAEALAEFLAEAASERPLLLLLDDIHWAEPGLLELVADLKRRMENAPILIVCLARPELLESQPDWPISVSLGPLDAVEVDELLDRLDAPAGARVRIAKAVAGNPLYAEELVAWLAEGGTLDTLPASLNALLSSRLDRLDPGSREALERGAVEGELFHRGAVVELTDQSAREAVPDHLDGLTRKDMIRVTAASLAGEAFAYHFKHVLVRDAAYRATTKKLRASLHERYANWLEQRAGSRVGEYHEVIGYHLEQAYRYRTEIGSIDGHAPELAARAGRHLGIAGRRANDRADVRAAANLLSRATHLLPPDSIERLELLRHLTYAIDQSGRMLEARTIAQELYERARLLDERRLAAHGKSYATPNPFFDQSADPEAARTAYEDVIATFTELGDETGLAAAKRRLALVYRTKGQSSLALKWLAEAHEHANAGDDMSTRRAVTYSYAGQITSAPIPVEQSLARVEHLIASCDDDPVLQAAISRYRSLLLAMAGRFDESRACELQAAPILDEANLESLSWGSLGTAALAMRISGDLDGAARYMERRWHAYPVESGKTQKIAIGAAQGLANIYCESGRWQEAEKLIAIANGYGDDDGLINARAHLAAHYGRFEEAQALAHQFVELRERTEDLTDRAEGWLVLAKVQRAAGLADEADTSLNKAIRLLEQKGSVAGIARARAAVLEPAARL
jgi:class 3 adenylate cyclase/tetratricopeptide (TPR) repeat protein